MAKQCANHYDGLTSHDKTTCTKTPTFEMYIVFMKSQLGSVSDMLDRSAGASELVCDILQPSNKVVAKNVGL